jgi:hypothetical protein
MRDAMIEGKCVENFTAKEIFRQSLPFVLLKASKWLRSEEEQLGEVDSVCGNGERYRVVTMFGLNFEVRISSVVYIATPC